MKIVKILVFFSFLQIILSSAHMRGRKSNSVDYEGKCTPHWWPRNDCKEGLTCDIEEKICKVAKKEVCGNGRVERECANDEKYKCLPPKEVFTKNGQEPVWICRKRKDMLKIKN
jgi:hypothetical protein